MVLKYTTAIKFNRALKLDEHIPDYPSTTSKETVGTGDGSTTIYYLDQKGVIEYTETLITGSTAESGATTTLTRGTHYDMDYDKSRVTLTASGVASVASTSIFADYEYNKYGARNTHITEALERAEAEIDSGVNSVFTSANIGSETPTYTTVTNELHIGQGQDQRVYQTDFAPINNSSTTTSGAISSSATTITVGSTTGFPSSGTAGIESDKFSYTGKSTTTFTGVTGLTASHDSATTVTSYVIESAFDDEGNVPNWVVMQPDSEYSLNPQSGNVKLVNNTVSDSIVFDNFQPQRTVWDRVRLSYQYGYDNIPEEIVRATHYIAGKDMFTAEVLNSLARGTDGFSTDSINDVDAWIKRTINKYKIWFIKRVGISN